MATFSFFAFTFLNKHEAAVHLSTLVSAGADDLEALVISFSNFIAGIYFRCISTINASIDVLVPIIGVNAAPQPC